MFVDAIIIIYEYVILDDDDEYVMNCMVASSLILVTYFSSRGSFITHCLCEEWFVSVSVCVLPSLSC